MFNNHFRKEELQLAAVCLSLLLIVAAIAIGVSQCKKSDERADVLTIAERKALNEAAKNIEQSEKSARAPYASAHLAEQLFPFDPNHADSATLLRLGLSKWQVSNMMKYRQRGGRWRSPDDFRRLYGLSENDFQRLRPYIRIAKADQRGKYVPFPREPYYGVPKGEEVNYEKQPKLSEGITLPLNTSDTTALKQLPGIGSYYAQKIVKYRERLGGFVNTTQLADVEGLPAGLSRWFTVESNPQVKQLRINHATFKELVRHPYLSYEQTKVIVNHVRQYGPIHSWRDLRLYKEFSEKDFERLTPYIRFD